MTCLFREVRTEHAKSVRRATGTNDFRDKEIFVYAAIVMPTVCATLASDNLLMEVFYV